MFYDLICSCLSDTVSNNRDLLLLANSLHSIFIRHGFDVFLSCLSYFNPSIASWDKIIDSYFDA